jgi:hypothetical protein
MGREQSSNAQNFGFLSTLESPEYGYFGGYLIVSLLGRPVEFHCTAPVRPSRAQKILYGPTLQPYLIGEQIGGALLKAAKVCPRLILVDAAAMLVARSVAASPMAVVIASTGPVDREYRSNAPVVAGGYELILPHGFENEAQAVTELASRLSQHVDLAEPFGRIHEAIREAQRIGGRGADAHGQAA